MKYTIIDRDKGAPFIQQPYDSLEETEKRLDALKQKFAGRYSLEIVGVDDAGGFHDLTSKPDPTPAITEQPTQPRPRQPRRQ